MKKKRFAQNGYNARSIRKAAAKLDIIPTTIYLSYKDKSDIVYAFHQGGHLHVDPVRNKG
ncbi:hypothetical protein GEO21_02960 [Sphingobacterium faecium]|uniref:TetR/AcrR family transcriptional regulator n=1 Tax=Sphingobacterium faecium TaxID=34087 RepID=UPI001290F480|nr:TetR/AcrR family transcriptional regulator [Sphingobacterium faecium]MQP26475.1 hypothetical protein [Sphingobacterium faecium]